MRESYGGRGGRAQVVDPSRKAWGASYNGRAAVPSISREESESESERYLFDPH